MVHSTRARHPSAIRSASPSPARSKHQSPSQNSPKNPPPSTTTTTHQQQGRVSKDHVRFVHGHSAWSPGQLQEELDHNQVRLVFLCFLRRGGGGYGACWGSGSPSLGSKNFYSPEPRRHLLEVPRQKQEMLPRVLLVPSSHPHPLNLSASSA